MTVTTAPAPATAPGRAFTRLDPPTAAAAQMQGALLVDIRSAVQRRRDGEIPGALVVSGPVRDWRVEPDEPLRVVELGSTLKVIVMGDGSAASILAASALRRYGVDATDVIGGFESWAAYDLPTSEGVPLVGRYCDDEPAPVYPPGA